MFLQEEKDRIKKKIVENLAKEVKAVIKIDITQITVIIVTEVN
ncbi:MAG: hypothetical protein ACE5R6_13155 [Candidatus Heimdallarchaeota archaeon]